TGPCLILPIPPSALEPLCWRLTCFCLRMLFRRLPSSPPKPAENQKLDSYVTRTVQDSVPQYTASYLWPVTGHRIHRGLVVHCPDRRARRPAEEQNLRPGSLHPGLGADRRESTDDLYRTRRLWQPQTDLLARFPRLGRRILRRLPDSPGGQRGLEAAREAALAKARRCFRARHCARTCDRPARLLFGRLLLGQAQHVCSRRDIHRESPRTDRGSDQQRPDTHTIDRVGVKPGYIRRAAVARKALNLRRADHFSL